MPFGLQMPAPAGSIAPPVPPPQPGIPGMAPPQIPPQMPPQVPPRPPVQPFNGGALASPGMPQMYGAALRGC